MARNFRHSCPHDWKWRTGLKDICCNVLTTASEWCHCLDSEKCLKVTCETGIKAPRSLHTHSDYKTFCLLIFIFLLFESSLFHSHQAKWKNSTTTTSRGACHKASRQKIEAQTQQGHLSYVCLKFGNLPSQSETPLEMRKGPKDGNNPLSYSSSQKTSRLKKYWNYCELKLIQEPESHQTRWLKLIGHRWETAWETNDLQSKTGNPNPQSIHKETKCNQQIKNQTNVN